MFRYCMFLTYLYTYPRKCFSSIQRCSYVLSLFCHHDSRTGKDQIHADRWASQVGLRLIISPAGDHASATATPSSKSCSFARIPCTALIRPARYTKKSPVSPYMPRETNSAVGRESIGREEFEESKV